MFQDALRDGAVDARALFHQYRAVGVADIPGGDDRVVFIEVGKAFRAGLAPVLLRKQGS